MTELPAYSGDDPTCIKCGYVGASTTHRFPRGWCDSRTPSGLDERLCRDCRRCGYHWDEALAAPPQAVELAASEGKRIPLGQQFSTGVFHESGESRVTLLHVPSGRYKVMKFSFPDSANAAEQPLVMFQALLDEVDEWGRQPAEGAL